MKNFKLSERVAEVSKYFINVKPSDVLHNIIRLETAMDQVINPICDKPLSETPYTLICTDGMLSEAVLARFLEDMCIRCESDMEFYRGVLDYLHDCMYRDKLEIAKTLTDTNIEDILSDYIKDRIKTYSILSKCISDTNKSIFKDVTDIEYCILLKNHYSDMGAHITYISKLMIENKASSYYETTDKLGLVLNCIDSYVLDKVKDKLKKETPVVLHKE